MREIIINHSDIKDSKTITKVIENKFKENDLDIHRHEVEILEDDHRKGVRRLQVKNSKYFLIKVPWKK